MTSAFLWLLNHGPAIVCLGLPSAMLGYFIFNSSEHQKMSDELEQPPK